MTYFYKLPLIAALTMVMSVEASLAAEDGFGVRFTNIAPAALSDTGTAPVYVAQEPSADELNEIAPAAGTTDSVIAPEDVNVPDAIPVNPDETMIPQDQTISE